MRGKKMGSSVWTIVSCSGLRHRPKIKLHRTLKSNGASAKTRIWLMSFMRSTTSTTITSKKAEHWSLTSTGWRILRSGKPKMFLSQILMWQHQRQTHLPSELTQLLPHSRLQRLILPHSRLQRLIILPHSKLQRLIILSRLQRLIILPHGRL